MSYLRLSSGINFTELKTPYHGKNINDFIKIVETTYHKIQDGKGSDYFFIYYLFHCICSYFKDYGNRRDKTYYVYKGDKRVILYIAKGSWFD